MGYRISLIKKISKYVFFIITALVIVITLAGVGISYFYEDQITQLIIQRINQSQKAEIIIEDASFSVLRKFPHATVELKNIQVRSLPGFNKTEFIDIKTNNFFEAQSLLLRFNLFDLLNGRYIIKAINANNATVSMFYDKKGKDNYSSASEEDSASSPFKLSLRLISVRDFTFNYVDHEAELDMRFRINKARLSGHFVDDKMDIKASADVMFKRLIVEKSNYINNQSVQIDGKLAVDGNVYKFIDNEITCNDQNFNFDGTYHYDTDDIEFNLSGSEIDLQQLIALTPKDYQPYVNHFKKDGTVNFKLAFGYGSKSYFNLHEIVLEAGDNLVDGKLKLSNFDHPVILASGNMRLKLADWKHLFADSLDEVNGIVETQLEFAGKLNSDYDIQQIDKLISTIPEFSIEWTRPNGQTIELEGKGSADNNNVVLDTAFLELNNQSIALRGTIEGLPKYLLSQSQSLGYKGIVKADELNINKLMTFADGFFASAPTDTLRTDTTTAPENVLQSLLEITNNLTLNIETELDELIYDEYTLNQVKSKVTLLNNRIDTRDLSFEFIDGLMKGNLTFYLGQNQLLVQSNNFHISGLSINRFFKQFNNFDQETLQADNIKGDIEAQMSFKASFDHLMNFNTQSLVLESIFTLTNGELIEFQPLENMSAFLHVSELGHIQFSTIKNNILIKNNTITIPQMNVKSTAFDIVVAGEHSLDDNFLYTIKVSVMDVLARKLRKRRNVIQEDEKQNKLGLYVTISGTSEKYTISYDRKKIRELVADRYNNNKAEIQRIMKEEYNWIETDTTITNDK